MTTYLRCILTSVRCNVSAVPTTRLIGTGQSNASYSRDLNTRYLASFTQCTTDVKISRADHDIYSNHKHPKAPNAFAGTEGRYLLPHHAKEIERLQTQHALILSSTSQTLVTAPLGGERVRVLDCGAADGRYLPWNDVAIAAYRILGTWFRDVHNIHPQYEWALHGVDIGSALFPPEAERNGMELVELDIRSPFPASLGWQNSFDLIHQRLLVWGLPSTEWPTAIKHLKSLLDEGQWVNRDIAPDPITTPNLVKLSELQKWSTSTFGMNINIAYELEDLLKTAGFGNVSKKVYSLGYRAKAKEADWKYISTDLWVSTFRSFALKFPLGGIPGVARDTDEFLLFLGELKKEVPEVGYAPQLNFVIGQK